MGNMETCYIEKCINGIWQQVSTGPIGTIQQDVDWWKTVSNDPIRAVDSNGRLVAM
jgi:hypothetical protein